MNIVIPMAGRGSRTSEFGVPKPLIKINGESMIELAVLSLNIPAKYIFIKMHYDNMDWNLQLFNAFERIERKLKAQMKDRIDYNRSLVTVISIDEVTDGQLATALLAKEFINDDEKLIITNCDQILRWNSRDFLKEIETRRHDGILGTYDSDTPKNSYIKLDENGFGMLVKEKEVISKHSLNGLFYWRHGKDFVKSGEELIKRNERVNNEFYIAPTYNVLIEEKKKISTYHFNEGEHWPVGTTEDIKAYLASCEPSEWIYENLSNY